MLELIHTIDALRARLNTAGSTARLGLVPTMGALHEGHARLIRRARAECDVVAVSIFVNPLQFNNQDDLARYPRTLDQDVAICRELGVDVVFAPSAAEVYPRALECTVEVGRLADHLCGKFRPGHFRGVATVVLKLFQMVQPHRAYFGQKDAQQLAIIKRLAADFNLPLEIVEVPTVRETDGLAMSSRNTRLSAEERRLAPSLYHALVEARDQISGGERSVTVIRANAVARIPATDGVKLEYFEVVDPETMQLMDDVTGPVRIAGAVWIGKTRLIDNVYAEPTPPVVRSAGKNDVDALVKVINDAFIVETFFKLGDRTSAGEIVELLDSGGEFLVAESADGKIAGCIYLQCEDERAYFGMLSVDPARQAKGLGHRLIAAVESRARERGCRFMDIHIVNLRTELPPYYRKLGYLESGELPFSVSSLASRSCHFIVMTKVLGT